MHTVKERNESEKATYCMIPTRRYSGKSKTISTIKRCMVAKGSRQRRKNQEVEHRTFSEQRHHSA